MGTNGLSRVKPMRCGGVGGGGGNLIWTSILSMRDRNPSRFQNRDKIRQHIRATHVRPVCIRNLNNIERRNYYFMFFFLDQNPKLFPL